MDHDDEIELFGRVVDKEILISEVVDFLKQAVWAVNQAHVRVVQIARGAADQPALSQKELARVEQFGEVAHRHLSIIEMKGLMTLGESLAIRREMYGKKVQTTANLFGIHGSGALF